MDHRRDDRDDEDHDRAQRVEPQRPRHVHAAGNDPLHERNDLNFIAREDVTEKEPAEHGRQQKRTAGDELRAPVADRPAEEAGNQRAEQRQKDNGDGQRLASDLVIAGLDPAIPAADAARPLHTDGRIKSGHDD
jgi:hypothetical protein